MIFLKKKKRKKNIIIKFFTKRSRKNYWWKIAHWSSWLFVTNAALICFTFFVILFSFNLRLILPGTFLDILFFLISILIIFSASVSIWYKLGEILNSVVRKNKTTFILIVSFWSAIPLIVMLAASLTILGFAAISSGIGVFTLSFLFAVSLISFLAIILQSFIIMIGSLIK